MALDKAKYIQWFCGFYEGEGSVSNDIGNYNITQVQDTQEYKFGLACYKVFGKGLAQITKSDVETIWADGRADGGIDLMYITEEDDKNILNICQASPLKNLPQFVAFSNFPC
jgi:hypothetical protein